MWYLDFDHLGSQVCQLPQCPLRDADNRWLNPIAYIGPIHTNTFACQGHVAIISAAKRLQIVGHWDIDRVRILGVIARHDAKQSSRVFNTARHRSEMI